MPQRWNDHRCWWDRSSSECCRCLQLAATPSLAAECLVVFLHCMLRTARTAMYTHTYLVVIRQSICFMYEHLKCNLRIHLHSNKHKAIIRMEGVTYFVSFSDCSVKLIECFTVIILRRVYLSQHAVREIPEHQWRRREHHSHRRLPQHQRCHQRSLFVLESPKSETAQKNCLKYRFLQSC